MDAHVLQVCEGAGSSGEDEDEDGQDRLSKTRRFTLRTLFLSDTSTITLKRSNSLPLYTHEFQCCFAHISPLRELFFVMEEMLK